MRVKASHTKLGSRCRLWHNGPVRECGKRVFKIFGSLILLALLFVPYKRTNVEVYQSGSSYLNRRVTTMSRGHMFLPIFIKNRGTWVSRESGGKRTTVLNAKMLAGEVGLLLFLAVFDYFIFCVWMRRRRAGPGGYPRAGTD